MNNNIFRTILILLGGMLIGFGLAIIFLYETYISRTSTLIILILSLIAGAFILGSVFLRKAPEEKKDESKEKENSDDYSEPGV